MVRLMSGEPFKNSSSKIAFSKETETLDSGANLRNNTHMLKGILAVVGARITYGLQSVIGSPLPQIDASPSSGDWATAGRALNNGCSLASAFSIISMTVAKVEPVVIPPEDLWEYGLDAMRIRSTDYQHTEGGQ